MSLVQLIVECANENEREETLSLVGELKYRLPMINSYVIEAPEENLHLLKGMEGIRAVHHNTHITAQMNSARKAVGAGAAEKLELTGRGVGLAILDTGVAPVKDLTLPHNRILVFKDVVKGENEPYDDNGHGTHVAGA